MVDVIRGWSDPAGATTERRWVQLWETEPQSYSRQSNLDCPLLNSGSVLVPGPKCAEYAVPHRRADAEVTARSVVMNVVQSVESAPVRAATDVGAVMVDPMVEEGKVVVSGIQPEDEERCGSRRTHEAEQLPYRDRSDRGNEERCGHERRGLGMVMTMTAPRDGRGAVQNPPMHGVLKKAKAQEAEENDANSRARVAGESVDAQA